MAITFTVDLGAAGLLPDALQEQVKAKVQYVVQATAAEAVARWQNAVMQAHLWNVEKQAYIDSIRWEATGELEATVYTDYAPAEPIETGRPARDLKAVLPAAKRARVVTQGKHTGQKYLIIPFRHNVPAPPGVGAHAPQMPPHIYAQAKALATSRVLGVGTRVSATGHTVPQMAYQWGGRLPAGLAPKARPHHVTDLYAGMVRFDTSTAKAKSSAYLTFRTMGEWSSGWVVPAKPGLYLARGVAEGLAPTFHTLITAALG